MLSTTAAGGFTGQERHAATMLGVLVLTLGILSTGCQPSPSPAASSGAAATTPPSPSRDFALQVYRGADELGGADLQFSRVIEQGRPVVLNFWAGQCPPCVAEMPTFQQLADEYQDRVLFVGIDVGPFTNLGTRDDALRLLNDLDVRYPTAAAADASAVKLYSVRSMPTTVFLARGGEIVSTTPGRINEDQLRASLENLLGAS